MNKKSLQQFTSALCLSFCFSTPSFAVQDIYVTPNGKLPDLICGGTITANLTLFNSIDRPLDIYDIDYDQTCNSSPFRIKVKTNETDTTCVKEGPGRYRVPPEGTCNLAVSISELSSPSQCTTIFSEEANVCVGGAFTVNSLQGRLGTGFELDTHVSPFGPATDFVMIGAKIKNNNENGSAFLKGCQGYTNGGISGEFNFLQCSNKRNGAETQAAAAAFKQLYNYLTNLASYGGIPSNNWSNGGQLNAGVYYITGRVDDPSATSVDVLFDGRFILRGDGNYVIVNQPNGCSNNNGVTLNVPCNLIIQPNIEFYFTRGAKAQRVFWVNQDAASPITLHTSSLFAGSILTAGRVNTLFDTNNGSVYGRVYSFLSEIGSIPTNPTIELQGGNFILPPEPVN